MNQIVIPYGLLKDAAVPMPSTYAYSPDPATVDTSPDDITILRIQLLYTSVRYKLLPEESKTLPQGERKDAAVPTPL